LFDSRLYIARILLTIVSKVMETDFQMEVKDREEAERELGASGGRGRTSQYEPVAQKWEKIAEDESILLSGLEKNDIQNLRNLLYRRFGKENVIVRSAQQDDETFKAVVRAREGNEYLREDE
jgi:hypothetical protein